MARLYLSQSVFARQESILIGTMVKQSRSWAGRVVKYGLQAAHGIQKGLKYANYGRKMVEATSRKTHTNATTGQHDIARQYNRKKMPKRKKKAWVKFSKKVGAVLNKQLNSRLVLLNDYNRVNTLVDTQGIAGIELNGVESATNTFGNNDLARIATADALWTVATNIRIESCCLDITVTNVNTIAAEIDVYEYYYRKDNTAADLATWMTSLLTTSPNVGTGLTIGTVGLTPFQVPGLGLWVRFTKKTKFFVAAGGTMTYQKRTARNYMFKTQEFIAGTNLHKRGLTQGLLFVQKGIPTATNGAGTTDLAYGATRTYNYKLLQTAQSVDGKV